MLHGFKGAPSGSSLAVSGCLKSSMIVSTAESLVLIGDCTIIFLWLPGRFDDGMQQLHNSCTGQHHKLNILLTGSANTFFLVLDIRSTADSFSHQQDLRTLVCEGMSRRRPQPDRGRAPQTRLLPSKILAFMAQYPWLQRADGQ